MEKSELKKIMKTSYINKTLVTNRYIIINNWTILMSDNNIVTVINTAWELAT